MPRDYSNEQQIMVLLPLEQESGLETLPLGFSHKGGEPCHTVFALVLGLGVTLLMVVMGINHGCGDSPLTVLWPWMLFLQMEATSIPRQPSTRIYSSP